MKPDHYDLQCIDRNCNDCAHLERLFGADAIAATTGNTTTVFYGHCRVKQRPTMFMPATCMPCNASCFQHRRDPVPLKP
jgi:hypothetical protein